MRNIIIYVFVFIICGCANLTSSSAKAEDVIKAAKEIYSNYPEILKALGLR